MCTGQEHTVRHQGSLVTCSLQVSGKLRANPTILKCVTSGQAQLLPALTCLKDPRLQSCIDIVKSHRAEVDVLNRQASTGNKIAAHSSKCCNRIGKILTDVCTKYDIHSSRFYRQMLQCTQLVLYHTLATPL